MDGSRSEKVCQVAREMNEVRPMEGTPTAVDTQSAMFVQFRKRVPLQVGEWRLVPPEASE